MGNTSSAFGRFTALKRSVMIVVVFMCFSNVLQAQNVLVVNDNDYITYNSDTLRNAMNHTIYSGYTYWSIPDSGGTGPSAAYMGNFDLVIWYCSTDGAGLNLWDGSSAGNIEIVNYVTTGKPLWIIGLDILYQEYLTPPDVFSSGEFAKDYMGLASYDVQSYGDDGSVGAPEADRTATASTLFPSTLKWQFSTLWFVDGCTASAGTLELYQMGPASYTFNGRKCMFHNNTGGYSVMSTFFDPALIDSFGNRVNFMEKGITYLLGGSTTGIKNTVKNTSFVIYPNPATTAVTIKANCEKATTATIEFYDAQGRNVKQQSVQLAAGKNRVSASIEELGAGLLFVSVVDGGGNVLYTTRLVKQ